MKVRIHFQYRRTLWWHFIHYNYFHKKLFKKFYPKKAKPTEKQIKKYHLYQKIDDIITLRNWNWLRIFIWKLDYGRKSIFEIVIKKT